MECILQVVGAPPHPTPPHCLLRMRDIDKPYPPRGEGRKGRGSACRDTPREGRAGCYAKGRDMCADVCGLNDGAEHEPMMQIPSRKDFGFGGRLAHWPPQSGTESAKAAW